MQHRTAETTSTAATTYEAIPAVLLKFQLVKAAQVQRSIRNINCPATSTVSNNVLSEACQQTSAANSFNHFTDKKRRNNFLSAGQGCNSSTQSQRKRQPTLLSPSLAVCDWRPNDELDWGWWRCNLNSKAETRFTTDIDAKLWLAKSHGWTLEMKQRRGNCYSILVLKVKLKPTEDLEENWLFKVYLSRKSCLVM